MAAPTLPPITSLSTTPIADQLQAIDTLFEPSPELHHLLRPILSDQKFSSYNGLVDAIYKQLSALSTTATDSQNKQALFGILGSHPRLGASSPTAQANLSELSRMEQANINNNSNGGQAQQQSEDQAARLSALNKEYEEKYPGLRYVTFVNGRGRDVIMVDMRRRIDRADFGLEIQDNIEAMCNIAKDRVKKLQNN